MSNLRFQTSNPASRPDPLTSHLSLLTSHLSTLTPQVTGFRPQVSSVSRFSSLLILAFTLCLAPLIIGGCETPPGGGPGGASDGSTGGGLFSPAPAGRERWTIRALQTSAPGHSAYVQRLADELKRIPGLDGSKVRIKTDATGSTLYYGEYVKVTSPTDAGRLIFPAEYQRDIDVIRKLIIHQSTPFFYAEPELVNKPAEPETAEFDVSKASGDYTLYIAVFYNTPGFSERVSAAEQYVRLLREAGHSAYFRHEEVRSYVFVGDFDTSDIVAEPDGSLHYGPRVERFISQRPEEFSHLTENGHLVKYPTRDGKMAAPQSYLVPVPREGAHPPPATPRPAAPHPFERP